MHSDVDRLKRNLRTIARTCSSVESALVLEQMLNREELSYRISYEGRRRICVWCSKGITSLLSRIAVIQSETQRACLELFADGSVEFVADDLGRGLNIYWFARDAREGGPVQ
jgi:hypothetical protein